MMSRKVRIGFLIGSLISLLSVVLWAIAPQTAFELDGNTTVETGANGVDWNLLNGDCTVPGGGSGQPDGTSTRTCVGSDKKIFTGGGSKDPLDISSWLWKPKDTVPDKDTLTHAYAATIQDANGSGDKVVYIGGDRFATNGDANIGAWFFQQAVDTTNVSSQGGFKFSGVHVDGDVFLVSAFVNGGGTAVLNAYIWNDPNSTVIAGGCKASNVKKNALPQPGDCVDTNLEFLGSTNTFAITNPVQLNYDPTGANGFTWTYDSKFGGSTTDPMPKGAFFEGGADLTALFRATGAGDVPCFSAVMLETRSSQETTATLKDFVLGSFPECKIEVFKDCNCTSIAGNTGVQTYTFGGTVHNSGGGTVHQVLVTDDAGTPADLTDDRHYNCGDLSPNGSTGGGDTKQWPSTACVETDGKTPTFTTSLKPPTNIVYAAASTATTGARNVNATPYSKVCSVQDQSGQACFVNPKIAVTKVCSADLADIGNNIIIRVTYSGTVQNTGFEKLNNVSVSEDDNNDGTPDVPNLTLQGCTSGSGTGVCVLNTGVTATFGPNTYDPDRMTVLGPQLGRASFTDRVDANGVGSISGNSAHDFATATCLACPAGQCPDSPHPPAP